MSGFKLLAIRPLKDCDKQFLKNLQPGMVYKFYQDYDYYVGNEKLTESNYNDFKGHPIDDVKFTGNDIDLYSKPDGLNINISAVVGKNGSGKSALMELFFFWIYKKSVECKYIDLSLELKNLQKERLKFKRRKEQNENIDLEIELTKSDIGFSRKKIEIEVFIEIQTTSNRKKEIVCFRTDETQSKSFTIGNINRSSIESFFYSVVLNYSMYGLNSEITGAWLDRLFHKNDGYMAPLVINPKRENGNIDIPNEINLSNSRVLANLIDEKSRQKRILKNKEIEQLEFYVPNKGLDEYNYFILGKTVGKNIVYTVVKTIIDYNDGLENVFGNIYTVSILELFDIDNTQLTNARKSYSGLISNLEGYVLHKLFKVIRQFRKNDFYTSDNKYEVITNTKEFIGLIEKDKSHKTLKIRQIINTIKFSILGNKSIEDLKNLGIRADKDMTWQKERKFRIGFKQFSKIVLNAWNPDKKLIEFIPNAFFQIRVKFKGEDKFENLSSGEQQFINSINTIIYHVLNIDSIPNHYKSVNVIFDEVELYFHPDFQRKFINELIRSLNNLKLDNVKNINILFLTHSPFILSDIPSNNILCLENGKSKSKLPETFAANVHDLLAHNFFLNAGFMGEFAKEKISNVIANLTLALNEKELIRLKEIPEKNLLKHEILKKEALIAENKYLTDKYEKMVPKQLENLISLIGEKALRSKLLEMLNDSNS